MKIIPGYGVYVKKGLFIWWPRWVFWPRIAYLAAWDYLPSFYACGACCCDRGGQVRTWYPVWFLLDRNIREWKDIGDGCDVFQRISIQRWAHWRFKLWRAGKSSQHVEDNL